MDPRRLRRRSRGTWIMVCLYVVSLTGRAVAQDWPMWGGTGHRNMVSAATDLPDTWDVKTGTNIKWKTQLGTTAYGNPVVAGGKIFLGTNNDRPRNPQVTGDRGILMCLRESDGEFLWQAVSDKLETGNVNDWPYQGVGSSPAVDGERLFYVTNRAELVSLDTEGFLDKDNDGPYDAEVLTSTTDADVIWKLDMGQELGVFPRNMANSSPLVVDDLVLVVTSNGRDDSDRVPAPTAPSFIAVNKRTGAVVWKDNSPGDRILHGQWSSPAVGDVNGAMQAWFAGGDGWLYALDARSGAPVWKFDLNPKDAVWPKTRNYGVATPVFHDGHVFMSVGQDPESGTGSGHMYRIDPTQQGDVTASGLVWHFGKIQRSISTPAIQDGLVYIADFAGFLYCLDAQSGSPYWTVDMLSMVWGSPLVADGKVYLADQDGDVVVLRTGKERVQLSEINMGNAVMSTPVAANGVLYVMTRSHLYAIASVNRSIGE